MKLTHWEIQRHGHANLHPELSSYCAPIDNVFRRFILFPADLTGGCGHNVFSLKDLMALDPPLCEQPHEHQNSWEG